MIYGRFSREEANRVFQLSEEERILEKNGRQYKILELHMLPNGATYQAQEIPSCKVEEEVSLEGKEIPLEVTVRVAELPLPSVTVSKRPLKRWDSRKELVQENGTPSSIRRWARKENLPLEEGTTFIPRETREAFQKKFGREILLERIKRDSHRNRVRYAKEGEIFPGSAEYLKTQEKIEEQIRLAKEKGLI